MRRGNARQRPCWIGGSAPLLRPVIHHLSRRILLWTYTRTYMMSVYPLYKICSFKWRSNDCVNSRSLIALLSSLIIASSRTEKSLSGKTSRDLLWKLMRLRLHPQWQIMQHKESESTSEEAGAQDPVPALCRFQELLLQAVRAELAHVNHTPRNGWSARRGCLEHAFWINSLWKELNPRASRL